MKMMKYCILVMTLLIACQANATMSPTGLCNITVDVNNANCNDNQLIDSPCGPSSPCDCRCGKAKCRSNNNLFEVQFNSVFNYSNLDGTITIVPFIQNPNGETIYGREYSATAADDVASIAVAQCLKVCLVCDGAFTVGYYFRNSLATAFTFDSQENNDSACVCNINLPLADASTDAINQTPTGVSQEKFRLCCAQCRVCDTDCCNNGCNSSCNLPFVTGQ